ncbi:hypothetical protein ACWERW_40620 [Streptomyces sp. NPDC004012]
MRNTKAFKEAVAQTLAELARRGVTLAPSTVEDTIEKNINAVAAQLRIQVRSAWRYFDASALADSAHAFEESSAAEEAEHAPMPQVGNPELALILAGVPDALAQTGGDLYGVIVNVAVNAWMAGHIHAEDGCTGCDGSRGPGRTRLGSPDAHDHRNAAAHRQVVRPRRVDPRRQRHRLYRHPPLLTLAAWCRWGLTMCDRRGMPVV